MPVLLNLPSGKAGEDQPSKVGEGFKLSELKKEADSQQTVTFKHKSLRISTWTGLQTAQLLDIPLMMLKPEFLASKGATL
jgi:hypothetical protein